MEIKMDEKNKEKIEVNSKQKKMKFLPGALSFFGLALYINIRGDHSMETLDWLVVVFGAFFLIFASWKDLKN